MKPSQIAFIDTAAGYVGGEDEEYAELTGYFDIAVKEEYGGNFAPLRRATDLVAT